MSANLVFITESNSLMRKALKDLVSEISLSCVGEASEGFNLLEKIKTKPDLLLLDLDMPYPTTPLEAVNKLKINYPSLRIVVLSHKMNKPLLIHHLISPCIRGCILKTDSCTKIKKAIKAVAEGNKHYSNRIVKLMLETTISPTPQLSKREAQVFFLASESDKEIAKKLGISVSTVRSHIRKIKLKLSIKKRRELTKLAL